MRRVKTIGYSRHVRAPLLLIVACVLLFGAIIRLSSLALLDNPVLAAVPKPATTIQPQAQATAKAVSHTNPTVANAGQPVCVPDTTDALPTGLDLTTAPNGLRTRIDPVHHYTVFGTTRDELSRQIISCAPPQTGGEYTAYTAYNITWRYDFGVSDGRCAPMNVKLGLHIHQVMPAWQSAAQASPAFTAAWQNFISALTTHEQGHVVLDEQYAAGLLNNLQRLSANDCAVLSNAVDTTTRNDLDALDQANAAYDARTGHGATQGAIIP